MKELEAAVTQFYKALNILFTGDAAPMIALWSHQGDTSYLGPQGEIVVGWEKTQESWQQTAALRLGGHIDPQDMHIVVNGNLGFTQNHEVGTNYKDNKPQTVKIRATNIFRKENGVWKMLSHQTDLLDYLKDG